MTTFHRILGSLILVLFVVIVVWGLALRLLRRDEAPAGLWAAQHWTENLLVAQALLGVVLLFLGRRVVGEPLVWLHYLYGSVFPLIALVGGRLAALRRERYEYLGLVWGAFFAFALVLRAVQTGCGASLGEVVRCFRI